MMKGAFGFRWIIVLLTVSSFVVNCSGQGPETNNATPFGKYFKIADYDIWVPFLGQPIETNYNNEAVTGVLYKYASGDSNDINILYACAVYKLKAYNENLDSTSRLRFVSQTVSLAYETILKATRIFESDSAFKGKICFQVKHFLCNSFNGEYLFIHSLFMTQDDYIIHLFVYTPPEKDGNEKINEFFNSVKTPKFH